LQVRRGAGCGHARAAGGHQPHGVWHEPVGRRCLRGTLGGAFSAGRRQQIPGHLPRLVRHVSSQAISQSRGSPSFHDFSSLDVFFLLLLLLLFSAARHEMTSRTCTICTTSSGASSCCVKTLSWRSGLGLFFCFLFCLPTLCPRMLILFSISLTQNNQTLFACDTTPPLDVFGALEYDPVKGRREHRKFLQETATYRQV
jgi:hypothetical protein